MKYCFYIIKDKNAIYKGNYSEKNSIEMNISSDGNYFVRYYIYDGVGRAFLDSQAICYVAPVFLDIFGSCVSRDVLEYRTNNKIQLRKYIARQSVFSSLSETCAINEERINLNSPFQKRMVFSDLNKTMYNELKDEAGKYLLMDLIDERFPICLANGNYYTISNEFMNAFPNMLENSSAVRKTIHDDRIYIDNVDVTSFIKEFCKRIVSIYGEEHIIIHKAFMLNRYRDKNGKTKEFDQNFIKFSLETNKLLNFMYNKIIEYMPKAHVIEMPEDTLADENNKWGLSPMHYTEEYYHFVYNQIAKLCL